MEKIVDFYFVIVQLNEWLKAEKTKLWHSHICQVDQTQCLSTLKTELVFP